MDRFLSVVGNLYQRLGLGEASADDSGIFTLYVDGDLPIFMRPGGDGADLILHAGIGAVPDAGADDLVTSLLEGTTVEMERSGFALGMMPGSDQVILMGRVPVEGLSDDAAFALLDRFVATASGWRDIFETLVSKAEDTGGADAAEPDDDADNRPPGRSSFQDFA
jgi:hypothetical protein